MRNGIAVNGPISQLVAGLEREQRVVVELVLLDLVAQEAAGQRAGVDRDARELGQHVRQAADVVLVGVGDEERPDLGAVLLEVGDVGHDEVDAEHLLVREHEAAVDDDDVVAVFEHVHVLADLPHPAERDDAEGRVGVCHGCLDRAWGVQNRVSWDASSAAGSAGTKAGEDVAGVDAGSGVAAAEGASSGDSARRGRRRDGAVGRGWRRPAVAVVAGPIEVVVAAGPDVVAVGPDAPPASRARGPAPAPPAPGRCPRSSRARWPRSGAPRPGDTSRTRAHPGRPSAGPRAAWCRGPARSGRRA